MIRSVRALAALHLAGNALLLWLGYYWLGIGESHTATLLWSAVVAVALLCGACWLHGATFAWFREGAGAFRATLRRLFPILVAALVVIAIYAFLARWEGVTARPSLRTASWLTLKLRKPVKPAAILAIFNAVLWLVRWAVIPVFALPLIADISASGWSGLRSFGRLAREWRYWLAAPILLMCALWLPLKLIGWVPQIAAFWLQMASFVVRLLAAYLLFTASWLLLTMLTSRGKLRWTGL
jgi:hypothetical protein